MFDSKIHTLVASGTITFPVTTSFTYSGVATVFYLKNITVWDIYVHIDSYPVSFEIYLSDHEAFIKSVCALIYSCTGIEVTDLCRSEMGMQGDDYCVFESSYRGTQEITDTMWEALGPTSLAGKYSQEDFKSSSVKCVGSPISYSQIGNDIGELVAEKQLQYGDSFGRSGAMLKILYPDGVPVDKLDDVLVIARILDKIFRIATDNDPSGESPYTDICGYALLAIKRNSK